MAINPALQVLSNEHNKLSNNLVDLEKAISDIKAELARFEKDKLETLRERNAIYDAWKALGGESTL